MRFRKGKKAYRLGKKNKESGRYFRYLLKIEMRRRQGIKLATAAISAMMGVAQLAQIQQSRYDKTRQEAEELWEKIITNAANSARQIINEKL